MNKKFVHKYSANLISLTLFALFVVSCSSISSDIGVIDNIRNRLERNAAGVMVVAHRACWRLAPENSLQAIEECIRLGVDMIEIDVRKTRDGQLVLIHDKTVDRTTDGSGLVSELTLAEITGLRLKDGLGGEDAIQTEYRVPTLEQALLVAKDRILVNLDVKADARDQSYLIAKDLDTTDQILIKMSLTSPQDTDLDATRFFGNTFFMPIVREQNGELIRQVASFDPVDPVAFEIIYQTEEQLILACREAALQKSRCWVNTMWERLSPGHSDELSIQAPDKHWGHLVKLGVNMFQTDRPEELVSYLSRKGLR